MTFQHFQIIIKLTVYFACKVKDVKAYLFRSNYFAFKNAAITVNIEGQPEKRLTSFGLFGRAVVNIISNLLFFLKVTKGFYVHKSS